MALVVALAATACGRADASSAPRMEGAYPSAEALVEAALDAVARKDTATLKSLLVTRDEHHDLLWESLPESETLTFEYARLLNEHNTGKAMRRALERYGGEKFNLEKIEYTDGTETYPGFKLHLGTRLTVVRESDGAEGELALLDVLVERPEGWKLLNYDE